MTGISKNLWKTSWFLNAPFNEMFSKKGERKKTTQKKKERTPFHVFEAKDIWGKSEKFIQCVAWNIIYVCCVWCLTYLHWCEEAVKIRQQSLAINPVSLSCGTIYANYIHVCFMFKKKNARIRNILKWQSTFYTNFCYLFIDMNFTQFNTRWNRRKSLYLINCFILMWE